jgi:hypothetical protein
MSAITKFQVAGCLLTLGLTPVAYARTGEVSVSITEPTSGAVVQQLATVKGTVSTLSARVWVVIQPQSAPECWAQIEALVSPDGRWQTRADFGRSRKDSGEIFVMTAIADPSRPLRPGKIECWPRGQARSVPVTVRRQ